jgi:hypothetical protein
MQRNFVNSLIKIMIRFIGLVLVTAILFGCAKEDKSNGSSDIVENGYE